MAAIFVFTGTTTFAAGSVTITLDNDLTPALAARLDTLETNVTAPLTTVDEALSALQAEVATLTADDTAQRAAFDALATVVRAFIADVNTTPGTLTDTQAAQAQAILDSLGSADTAATTEAADEAALQAEVPAPPAA